MPSCSLLMQGANPRKYGRTGAIAAQPRGKRPRIATNAEVREALAGRLAAFRDRVRARRAAKGTALRPATARTGRQRHERFARVGAV